jgi:hypothetical protein
LAIQCYSFLQEGKELGAHTILIPEKKEVKFFKPPCPMLFLLGGRHKIK